MFFLKGSGLWIVLGNSSVIFSSSCLNLGECISLSCWCNKQCIWCIFATVSWKINKCVDLSIKGSDLWFTCSNKFFKSSISLGVCIKIFCRSCFESFSLCGKCFVSCNFSIYLSISHNSHLWVQCGASCISNQKWSKICLSSSLYNVLSCFQICSEFIVCS